ncbi:hypothetical protein Atai01_45680 [Amycolatopsis taiwanensis]|uniref:N-acetyltransferase domain-containing protein n=1 Tax=Amycolatopsis taiwanensis TaxID=342230 RepID=A0A9W6R2I2_9PSEU|nr:hypothetical protein Atai01_45680 [Amycolatopsis taiwanensis]
MALKLSTLGGSNGALELFVVASENLRLRPATPDDYDRIVGVVDEWAGLPIRSGLPRLFLDHFHRTSLVAEDGVGWRGS